MRVEVNPNHPVTAGMREHWHKIVGLLLHKLELGEVVITGEDLQAFERDHPDAVVMIHDRRDGIHLKIITNAEAQRLAREQGGLPT